MAQAEKSLGAVRFGPFEFSLETQELRKYGVPLKLSGQAIQVLAMLTANSGKLVTREELQRKLWPAESFGDFEHGLNAAVNKLREKLGDSATTPTYIETLQGRGYRFIAEVQLPNGIVAPEPEEPAAVEPEPPKARSANARKGRTLWVAVGAVALIAVIVIVVFFWQSSHRAVSTVSSAIPRAIAVLPFQNVGTDKDTDFLRLAVPDEIATTLSYVPSLSIRPFATTSKYNGPNLDLQQAGREMGVTSIVTGHYLTEDDRLEVTLEAVDVANNRSIWRDTINVAAPDRIAMQEQVTSKVRHGLVPVLGGLSAGDQGTRPKSEEAYDLYLRSVAIPHDVSPNKAAIAMLERVVGIDPSYAPAWDALGARYYFEADYGEGGQAMLKHSDEAIERALALDPNLIGASLQLITNRTERGELRNAYAEALALIKRRPDSAYAHFALAYVLRYAGLLDESAHECDTALALDRSDYFFRSCSLAFMQLGQPERAMEFVRLDAGSQFAARQTALILLGQGKVDEARQTIQRTSDTPLMGRDLLQACLDPKQASQLDGAAQRMEAASVAEGDAEGWYIDGVMLSYCGQKDAALRLLKRAVGQNYCAYEALQTDPLLLKLRRTPEFTELLSAAKHCQNTFLVQRNQSPH